eukprot:10547997-Alexandrium_andersonii.AAC.1
MSASTPTESRSAGCPARRMARRRLSTTWSSASRDALRVRLLEPERSAGTTSRCPARASTSAGRTTL